MLYLTFEGKTKLMKKENKEKISLKIPFFLDHTRLFELKSCILNAHIGKHEYNVD